MGERHDYAGATRLREACYRQEADGGLHDDNRQAAPLHEPVRGDDVLGGRGASALRACLQRWRGMVNEFQATVKGRLQRFVRLSKEQLDNAMGGFLRGVLSQEPPDEAGGALRLPCLIRIRERSLRAALRVVRKKDRGGFKFLCQGREWRVRHTSRPLHRTAGAPPTGCADGGVWRLADAHHRQSCRRSGVNTHHR